MRKTMKHTGRVILAAAIAFSLSACGQKDPVAPGGNPPASAESGQVVTVDLEEVHQAVKDVYGEAYIPSAAYDETAMEDLFGLTQELYEACVAEGPMISVHVDTFVAVKAKEGKGEEIEKILTDYRKGLAQDSMQYPMNQSKVEASQIVRHGDYVFFVMLGTASDEAMEEGEEAALESSKEENQKAVDVINGFFL